MKLFTVRSDVFDAGILHQRERLVFYRDRSSSCEKNVIHDHSNTP
jgi:hypothetical protein